MASNQDVDGRGKVGISSTAKRDMKAKETMTKTTNSSSPDALVKTTISLVLLQLISRLFSFSLNQVLLRSTTPQALGVATMGFEVVRDTGLFLAREGIRGAIVRSRNRSSSERKEKFETELDGHDSDYEQQLLRQTSLIPVFLIPLMPLCFFAYFWFFSPSSNDHNNPTHSIVFPFFKSTLALYTLSAIIELLAEPYYLRTLHDWESLTGLRVRLEGLAVVAKAMATLIVVRLGNVPGSLALLAFGVGQLAYALTLLIGFWLSSTKDQTIWQLEKVRLPHTSTSAFFDPKITVIGWALTRQSLVKQLLTEGDKIVVGRLSKIEDQGGYAVALNYGSLIARILFQPLEESSRLFFSRTLSNPNLTQSDVTSAASLLSTILLLHTHLSLIFILLAPSYTAPLLYHLLGKRWSYPQSSAPLILRAYCVYLPFLAINGVTEAFFQSVAEERWIKRGSAWMMACSVAFLTAVYIGVQNGWAETGLVYANCVNMFMRIMFSSYFIRDYFNTQTRKSGGKGNHVEAKRWKEPLHWTKWTPNMPTFVSFLVSQWFVKRSEEREEWRTYKGMGEHVAIGAGCGVLCISVILLTQREALGRLVKFARKRGD